MKTAGVYVSILAGIGAVAFTIWLGWGTPLNRSKNRGSEASQEAPLPSATGPHPKAVTDETEHDFGVMTQGAEGKHRFAIRNEGEAPLQMVALKKDMTCQCTFGKIGKNGLLPGESTVITLSWTIKIATPQFRHHAIVRTNDPNHKEIPLIIRGIVGKTVVVKPHTEFYMGKITGENPTEKNGIVYSEVLDEFEIQKIESTNPLLTTEFNVLTKDELKQLVNPKAEKTADAKTSKDSPTETKKDTKQQPVNTGLPIAKYGYSIKATLGTGIAVGPFREQLTVHTNIEDAEAINIYVSGSRTGPFEMFSLANCRWSQEHMLLFMGRFPAAEGRKSTAMMFFKEMSDDLEILDIKSDPDFLKISVERDEEFNSTSKNTQKVMLTVEVPAGSPAVNRNRSNRAQLTLKTNHPVFESLAMQVEFVSTASR